MQYTHGIYIILETKMKISIYYEFHCIVYVRYGDVYNEDNRKYLIYFEIYYNVRKLGSDERKCKSMKDGQNNGQKIPRGNKKT